MISRDYLAENAAERIAPPLDRRRFAEKAQWQSGFSLFSVREMLPEEGGGSEILPIARGNSNGGD